MNTNLNLVSATDTYKAGHWKQYPLGTTGVYSYYENRVGAQFPETRFFGLQPLLFALQQGITKADIDDAEAESFAIHGKDVFNRERWDYILKEHNGRLPLDIKAVAEGTIVPINNVLFTVEATDPKCFWLTGHVESFLTHSWHPSLVATVSWNAKKIIKRYLDDTSDNGDAALPFMLHDFGYRGATSHESAQQAGAAHLTNFLGSDTWPALRFLRNYYGANIEGTMYSVVASEHSTMTALGRAGEFKQVQKQLEDNPTGIVSCVGDSYDIIRHAEMLGTHFKPQIQARDGKWVLRPDSLTPEYRTKGELNVALLEILGRHFGYTVNSKGFKVLSDKVGLIDGDGNKLGDIADTLDAMMRAGWAAENIVFGMGGGLHQAGLDRDTMRSAFKAAAIRFAVDGLWKPVQKNPLDQSKKSKAGRLRLVRARESGNLITVSEATTDFQTNTYGPDLLERVFYNGEVVKTYTLAEIRETE